MVATEIFSYINKKIGVNQDGEQYICISVLSRDNKKFNFITKNAELIDKISALNFTKFQDLKIHCDFNRQYNKEKRTSYWVCEVVGVG